MTAAANYVLFIPRANYLPGDGGIGKGAPGSTGANPDPTEALMAGSRPPFVIDVTLWSTLKFRANSPYRTVGRQIVIVGDAAWGLTHYAAEAAYAAAFPVAANAAFSMELTAEDQILYVAAATGSVNLHVWVTR
jgi:hypothetical protein